MKVPRELLKEVIEQVVPDQTNLNVVRQLIIQVLLLGRLDRQKLVIAPVPLKVLLDL